MEEMSFNLGPFTRTVGCFPLVLRQAVSLLFVALHLGSAWLSISELLQSRMPMNVDVFPCHLRCTTLSVSDLVADFS